jgi:opacity protein-like surface antigen
MEFYMKKVILAALAVAAFSAQAAGMAADEGYYVGLNTNHTKFTCDNCTGMSTNALGVYGGYRMGNIAGEVAHFQKSTNGVDVIITDFSVIPRINVAKDVDVLGKLGVRYSSGKENSLENSGTSLVVGAGVEYTFMPQVSARAMVDYSSDTFGVSTKTTTTTIGVAYKF